MKRLLCLLLIAFIFSSAFAQKQKLELNLVKGQTYFQNMQSSTLIKQKVQGQDVAIDIIIGGKISFTVTDVRDSIYDINVVYKRLTMKMKLPTGNQEMDSEKENAADAFSKMLGVIKNKVFQMQMARSGKIVAVKNIESIFGDMFSKLPNLSAAEKKHMEDQLKKAYGAEAFKGSFEMATSMFPTRPVGKGDSWEVVTNLKAGTTGALATTYTFADQTENYILLTGAGKLEMGKQNEYSSINGVEARQNLSGTMNSTVKLDPKTGWVIEAKIHQVIDGTTEIKESSSMPGGMVIPMKMETRVEYVRE